jgi:predicted permease
MKPIPGLREDDRVAELLSLGRSGEFEVWAYPNFQDVAATRTPFAELSGWKDREGTLTTGEGGERVRLMHVSANYFRLLGVVPSQGRTFFASEDVSPGQHPVAVVSHEMWQGRLGGDPDIIGRTLTLNRTPYAVVGVAPEGFQGHRTLRGGTEIWLPLTQDPWVAGEDRWVEDREARWLRVLGRLREGVSLAEANAALGTVFSRLEAEHPEANEGRSARAYALRPVPAIGRTQTMMGIGLVFALLGLVLLIICGNVAGMVLARVVTREQEIAIRLSLGSGRGRLIRLLLAEALLLALMGGGIGLLLGVWGIDAAYATLQGGPDLAFGFNGPTLLFALALSGGTTMAVGLIPAVRFSRPDLLSSLKDDTGGGGRRVSRIHRLSASGQTGVALTLLVTCSLFLRAQGVMERRELGFESQGLFTTRLDLSQAGLESQDLAEGFLERVREAMRALPGVASTSISDGIPLDLSGNFSSVSRAEDPDEARSRVTAEFTRADEGYFETIGTPLLRGRGFAATDDLSSEPVMVITESLAARLWPGEDAIGRRVRSGSFREGPREFTVVGVVGEVASSRATESWPNIFVSLRQSYQPRIMVAVRGAGNRSALSRAMRSALLDVDPSLPFPLIVPSETLVFRSTQGHRTIVLMAGGLGLLALLLSAIGVYGVVSFSVSNRTREIGLRMAMGASRRRVLRGVLRDAVRLAVPGLMVGALLAGGVAAVSRSQLFGLSPLDPVSFGAAVGVLFLVVLLASLVPARRASGIHPMGALRQE